ncbi:mucin-2-like [Penaeus japonicus]|uniref:mucin-2-like n=1 Tax=Penaeus japonicus TaxID=27405 RepID=UPI001C70F3C3|nr:mucin-2-like [Penaeus japonicus]
MRLSSTAPLPLETIPASPSGSNPGTARGQGSGGRSSEFPRNHVKAEGMRKCLAPPVQPTCNQRNTPPGITEGRVHDCLCLETFKRQAVSRIATNPLHIPRDSLPDYMHSYAIKSILHLSLRDKDTRTRAKDREKVLAPSEYTPVLKKRAESTCTPPVSNKRPLTEGVATVPTTPDVSPPSATTPDVSPPSAPTRRRPAPSTTTPEVQAPQRQHQTDNTGRQSASDNTRRQPPSKVTNADVSPLSHNTRRPATFSDNARRQATFKSDNLNRQRRRQSPQRLNTRRQPPSVTTPDVDPLSHNTRPTTQTSGPLSDNTRHVRPPQRQHRASGPSAATPDVQPLSDNTRPTTPGVRPHISDNTRPTAYISHLQRQHQTSVPSATTQTSATFSDNTRRQALSATTPDVSHLSDNTRRKSNPKEFLAEVSCGLIGTQVRRHVFPTTYIKVSRINTD